MFISGKDNTTAIRELIEKSDNLYCAVAFIGKESEELLRNKKGRIICNLDSGSTNPFVIETLLKEKNFSVKNNPLLHAKVYLNKSQAIVGSANLSANGLGYEGESELKGWHEAGILIKQKEEINNIYKWFQSMWISDDCKSIESVDIANAKEIWMNNRNRRKAKNPGKSIFDVLERDPSRLENKKIYLVITTSFMTEEGQTMLAEVKEQKLHHPEVDAYEDWGSLPPNAFYIDFYIGPRGGNFRFYGLFGSPKKRILVPSPHTDGKSLFLCHRVKDIFGWTISEKDQSLLKSKARILLDSDLGEGDEGYRCIPLLEAREILLGPVNRLLK